MSLVFRSPISLMAHFHGWLKWPQIVRTRSEEAEALGLQQLGCRRMLRGTLLIERVEVLRGTDRDVFCPPRWSRIRG